MQKTLPQDHRIGNRTFAIILVLMIGLVIGCAIAFWPIYTPMIALCLIFGLAFTCIGLFELEKAVLIMIALFPFSYTLPVVHTSFFDLKLVYILSFIVTIIFFLRFSTKKDLKIVKSPLNLPLIAFLLVNFFSIFISVDAAWSFREFIQLLHYILIYFIVLNVIRDKDSIKKAVRVFIIMCFLSALVGLSQFFFGKPVIPQICISTSGLNITYPDLYYKTIMVYRRVSSFFPGNALGFANFLLPGLLILIGIILGTENKRKNWLYFKLAVMGAAFLFTYTRGAWIGFIFSLFILLVLVGYKKRLFVFSVFSFLLLPFFVFQSLGTRLFLETMSNIGNLGYLYLWKIGLNIIRDNPILGVGCGATQLIIGKYTSLTSGPLWLFENVGKGFHLHNGLLTIWAETGTVGLLVGIWILLRFLKANINAIRNLELGYWKFLLMGVFTGIIGLLVHFLTITGLVEHFWILLGINMSIITLIQKEREHPLK